MSDDRPPVMLPPRPAVDGDDDGLPADELALAPAPAALAPDPMLEPPPMLAFFNTKVPPLPPDADDAPAGPVLLLDPAPSPRCRQPVAVTDPAESVAERPVVG